MAPNNLTDDQRAKARACKTAEDLAELAEEQDLELNDEQLEAVSGGIVNPFAKVDCTSYQKFI